MATPDTSLSTPSSGWDLGIRLGHWLMATLFLLNYWWLEEGEDLHEWAGYALFAILVIRFIRGFTGPENARFRDFFPTPKRLINNLKNFKAEQLSHQENSHHSAIGGLMVLFLLITMTITAVSGWMQELDAFWGEDWVQNLHAWSADAVMIAVVIHVSAVLIIQYRYKVSLIKHMFSGKK
jgi:cytochrome b